MVDPAERGLGSPTSFVELQDGQLVVDGVPWRFASFNCPELLDGDVGGLFEVRDTMATIKGLGRPVTRSYTLRVNSTRISRGHIKGWNAGWNDWEWDGDRLHEMDVVLAEAAKAGVRLIIPFINQNFGGEDTNWVGNWLDLIRMRKGLSYDDSKKVDWWTDQEMIESFKLLIDKILNRVNSVNGRKYGDDPTILAWETGNEMNRNGYGAAPASWTLVVAKHIKSRSKQLVMDGSFARTDNVESCFPQEVLECRDVDILSYHYYGGGETKRLAQDCAIAKKYGKAFIAGEYGFYQRPEEYQQFLSVLDSSGGAGSLVWSLRPHSSQGGFKTHGEGNGQWSYHVPGWAQPLHSEFDTREADIVEAIRCASFKINSEMITPPPIPLAPEKLWIQSTTCLCWTGSAWASTYQLLVKNRTTGEERSRQVVDCTKEGCLGVNFSQDIDGWQRRDVAIRLRPLNNSGLAGPDSREITLN
ncbi:glycoside hydrolase [Meredithblackwellia eburnea MCA 4105]